MERGTGNTTRLLAATPAGGAFITHSQWMTQYIKEWIKQNGRESDNIRVMSAETASKGLRGVRLPVAIDHTVFEMCSLETIEHLMVSIVPAAAFILGTDENGNVVTWWNRR